MANRDDLRSWVMEAVLQLGGSGTVLEVCKVVWQRHEHDLRGSGDLFYTWQYDIRWEAQKLRDAGQLAKADGRRSSPWKLA